MITLGFVVFIGLLTRSQSTRIDFLVDLFGTLLLASIRVVILLNKEYSVKLSMIFYRFLGI